LIFTGVEKLETNLDLAIFKENEELDGQILETQLISSSEVDSLETWKSVVLISNYEKHSENILVIIVCCQDIHWQSIEQ
jgi:hypothetical protein